MNSSITRFIIVAGILLLGLAQAGGDGFSTPRPSTVMTEEKGREWLIQWLAKIKGSEGGQIIAVTEEAVAHAFPSYLFYVLRFRQYPIARPVPEPLKCSNIFAVRTDGSIKHLVDVKELEAFFRSTLVPVKNKVQAREVTRAWLRLSQEFYQDGFFKFTIPNKTLAIARRREEIKVSGKAVVVPEGGNKGEITASLTFDQTGKLMNVVERGKVFPGIRPICQAAKLLDPDPVVRAMAEQAMLVMGSSAKEYLDEQRVKASPELQHAIDRLWQRILAEDR